MKQIIFLSILSFSILSCASGGSVSSGSSSTQESSAEAKAKQLTAQMKTVLGLSSTQEDKVLTINVVNEKMLQRIRTNNEQNLASTTKDSYHKELKTVLSDSQFSKFRSSFPSL